MRFFTQAGWVTLQVAVIAPWVIMWVTDDSPNRPGLHIPILLGVVTAFVLTATIVGWMEMYATYRRWKLRRHERRISERLAVNHDQRGGRV